MLPYVCNACVCASVSLCDCRYVPHMRTVLHNAQLDARKKTKTAHKSQLVFHLAAFIPIPIKKRM